VSPRAATQDGPGSKKYSGFNPGKWIQADGGGTLCSVRLRMRQPSSFGQNAQCKNPTQDTGGKERRSGLVCGMMTSMPEHHQKKVAPITLQTNSIEVPCYGA